VTIFRSKEISTPRSYWFVAAQRDIKRLMELGLQKNPDVETNLAKYTGIVSQEEQDKK
jgi:hypothetical protein